MSEREIQSPKSSPTQSRSTGRRRASTTACVLLALFIVLALPVGFLVLSTANTDASCEGGVPGAPMYEFDIDQCKAQGAEDRALGGALLALCLLASLLILLLARGRKGSRFHGSSPCPQCGRRVSSGVPTCLSCGHSFVRT